jgi:hypothetical protein
MDLCTNLNIYLETLLVIQMISYHIFCLADLDLNTAREFVIVILTSSCVHLLILTLILVTQLPSCWDLLYILVLSLSTLPLKC